LSSYTDKIRCNIRGFGTPLGVYTIPPYPVAGFGIKRKRGRERRDKERKGKGESQHPKAKILAIILSQLQSVARANTCLPLKSILQRP